MPRNQIHTARKPKKVQPENRFNTIEYAFEHADHADHPNNQNMKGNKMKNTSTGSRTNASLVTSIALFAGVAVGGYLIWRNRSRISSFISDSGIADRFTAVTDKVASLVGRTSSSVGNAVSSTSSPQRSLERRAS